ncbi:tyrosine phosphatase family protein [Polymorphum gilvum]|uniref:Tyrosine specific protein phosphatase and dual specificity protein phosphatase n=1 Tax=Polymorphum gilvum (strain LMG 25793 / CGMCC 1.9160 / SL003B-26A1) TaxID=991905 RepID=F2IZ32_POLGS|nr:tyrosine phosphatase family protein [Polymorphum gilvum]ADZ71755.1 Tyrosine specific protein phosphatase and dual specificity protein phosphatase [Polymorphum gilvum SL003B-26A1]
MLYVCPLSRLKETVDRSGASHLVSLINADTHVERPDRIGPDRHLFLGFNDIVDPVEGLIPPGEAHVASLLRFVRDWDRSAPMVIHCWAGISRSTAGAFIAACALEPERDEAELAAELRARAPSATPNGRLIAMADRLLARDGRMIDSVRDIGRGATAFEGTPFVLPIG